MQIIKMWQCLTIDTFARNDKAIMKDLQHIRTEYTKFGLDESTADKNPIAQFQKWFMEAQEAGVPEPNAMSVATVSPDGRPSVRILLLKGIENDAFVFYTNYQSKKGGHLVQNPACALTFFWPELERQVRIEGIAGRVPDNQSTTYFQSRPRGSQLGAWASPQSAPIKNRALLEERLADIEKRFKDTDSIPKPQQWGGYAVKPYMIEFWQGRPNRLHDRIEYLKVDNSWVVNRLAP
jgi:pyridoxamine 5'-phosphate oxidase